MPILFGEFALDPAQRRLRRGTEDVHLTPKAYELLSALVERRPQAVGRADLEKRIWPGVHVAETSLAGLVAELRTALGDKAREARFVRTVHGFGYAFCAEARAAGEGAEGRTVFRLAWARREVELRPGENVLGRDHDVAAWIDSPTVSRRHARILVSGEEAVLEDLGSRNGTLLRGEKLASPARLADGDEIRLGSVTLTFRMAVPGETESQSG